jgi:hypothetical protein
MKSELGLNVPLKNPLDTLHRRLGFQVPNFTFQVCSISRKELQCMNVHISWRCRKCVHSSRYHFCHLLWSGCFLFVICWPMGLLHIWAHAERVNLKSLSRFWLTGWMIYDRLLNSLPIGNRCFPWLLSRYFK